MSGCWNKDKWPNGKRKKEKKDRKSNRVITNYSMKRTLLNILYKLDLSDAIGYILW